MNQFQDRHGGDDGIGQVRLFVSELVHAFNKRGQSENKTEAIGQVARHCRVSRSDVRKFYQPSRAPKAVSVRLWQRFWQGYTDYLRREIAALEARLAALEKLDHLDHGSRADLAVEAQALIARLREALD